PPLKVAVPSSLVMLCAEIAPLIVTTCPETASVPAEKITSAAEPSIGYAAIVPPAAPVLSVLQLALAVSQVPVAGLPAPTETPFVSQNNEVASACIASPSVASAAVTIARRRLAVVIWKAPPGSSAPPESDYTRCGRDCNDEFPGMIKYFIKRKYFPDQWLTAT